MNILIVGSGGREHALAWKISQSEGVANLYCAPGNAGIASVAECVEIAATDITELITFAKKTGIDLAIIGPESPLILGIVDEFEAAGIKAFGPRRDAAAIEGSKVFAKKLMTKYGIPTANYMAFSDPDSAIRWIHEITDPSSGKCNVVVKADGEARGKGVFVCKSGNEALDAIRVIMIDRVFGDSGDRIIIEECIEGQEASIMCITDGSTIIPLLPAQDYKRAYDNDQGPNTGGMGSYAPVPAVDDKMYDLIMQTIIQPTIKGMESEGRIYNGLLYVGLMITEDGPKVLEFNARFGDPETQAVLPLMECDLLEIMMACKAGNLDSIDVKWYNKKAVCVVAASGGYPGEYKNGYQISGLETAERLPNVKIFHAGTRYHDGYIITDGGRVLSVTGMGDTYAEAIDLAYGALRHIGFKDIFYRKDIGARVREPGL